jgi:hypothetical protein
MLIQDGCHKMAATAAILDVRTAVDKLRLLLYGHNSLPNTVNTKMIELVADFILM